MKMYDKTIKELEARIEELEKKCREHEEELDSMSQEISSVLRLARAVCEIQEHLRDNDPNFFLINRIHAPTMVGQK